MNQVFSNMQASLKSTERFDKEQVTIPEDFKPQSPSRKAAGSPERSNLSFSLNKSTSVAHDTSSSTHNQ
jgi:hypothetical protein